MNSIEVRGLEKSFGEKKVLRQLSFSLKAGERLALVGQNGSGKTTLIRCLLGLYDYSGSIEVLGFDPRRQRERALREIGFVPQSAPALRMSVEEFLRVNETLCGCPKGAMIDCAKSLGLDVADCLRRPFKNLSGGMKQKLLISAAVARRPKILFMDEPAASLDPGARASFFARLSSLSPDTVMILSSHRVDEISGLVSRLIEMDAGTIAIDDVIVSDGRGAAGRLNIAIDFHAMPELVAKNLREWGLIQMELLSWHGTFVSADRFRFLSMLSRWSGLIRSMRMEKEKES
jgi:ABC-2 type transport system ATP-binding protein